MDHELMDEVKRRTRAGWSVFGNLSDIMRSNMPICLKRKLFNQCVLPAMMHGSETWAVTKKMEQKLKTTQHSMERTMLGISKRDRKTQKQKIRNETKVADIIQQSEERNGGGLATLQEHLTIGGPSVLRNGDHG